MPYSPLTGVFTRVNNSFSDPITGTVIDPDDADALFDDYDLGFNSIFSDVMASTFLTPTQPQQAVILRNIGAAQFILKNGKITEGHASNAATFSIVGLDGNAPSATNPVTVIFGDGTQRAITAATSVTIPSGATMGASNGVAFRIWLSLVDDAGTLRLGVRNCSDANGIYGFPGNGIDTTVAITTAADIVAATFTNAAATSKQFVIVGFADYDSGLTAAGTWDASPTRIQLYAPGMAKPGDLIGLARSTNTTQDTTTAATYTVTTNTRVTISITSKQSLIRVRFDGSASADSTRFGRLQLSRGTTSNTNMIGSQSGAGGTYTGVGFGGASCIAIDRPAVAANQTYSLQFVVDSGAGGIFTPNSPGTNVLLAEELCG